MRVMVIIKADQDTEAGVLPGEETGKTPIHHTIDAVWHLESAKIIAVLTRMVGDVQLAEDLAQDTFVIALEQ